VVVDVAQATTALLLHRRWRLNSARPSPWRRRPAAAAGHAVEEERWDSRHLHHDEARLELLAAVALRSAASAPAPGMMGARWLIIWQPLQTPSAKVSLRCEEGLEFGAQASLKRIDLAQPWPAPSTSP
jgi:hypothetical protein